MKNLLIIILFLPSLGIAQYNTIVNTDNEWITRHQGPFSPQITYTESYFSEETTIIDGKEYKELIIKYLSYGGESGTDIFYRETGKRVYMYTEQKGENLVYDFNLEVGDTFSQEYSDFFTDPLYVLEVETIYLNDNLPRKKISLLCKPYEEYSLKVIWIEGIGGNSSIGSETDYCNHDNGTYLNCFFQYGQHLFTGEYENSCFLPVNNIDNKSNLYRIFPNPVQDHLTIEGINTPFEYTIKTIDGKTVLRGQGEQRIEVQQLPAGMYVLEIMTENKIGVMKFVKR